jgi:hypothetical protein
MFCIEEKLSLFRGFVEARNSVPYMGTWDGRSQWCNRLARSMDLYGPVFLWERESEQGKDVVTWR